MDAQFIYIIAQLGYLSNLIVIPLATIITGRKMLKERKLTGKMNSVRFLIFRIFLLFSILVILEFIVNAEGFQIPIINELFGSGISTFNLYSFLIGLIATLGMSLIFFGNRWESFYYFGPFFFVGMTIFFLLTGFDAMLEMYIYIAGILSIIFLYSTGFRLKDNGALGLAIFFTIAFGTVAIDIDIITRFSVLIYDAFILIFALGFFKPFKQREEVVE